MQRSTGGSFQGVTGRLVTGWMTLAVWTAANRNDATNRTADSARDRAATAQPQPFLAPLAGGVWR
jgi:hypothetical protein